MRLPLRAAAVCAVFAAPLLSFQSATGPYRIVRGPYLQPGPLGSIAVAWYTDTPTTEGQLQWRREGDGWQETRSFSEEPTFRHEVLLYPLQEGASYSYRVVDRGQALANLTAQSEFAFRAPLEERMNLVAFGDSGSGTAPQRAVAESIGRQNPLPDFILHTGDVVYPAGADSDYDAKFFRPYSALLWRIPFYPALGNHDYDTLEGAAYLSVFSLPPNGPAGLVPETAYWFEKSGVLFIVHDSHLRMQEARGVAAPWHVAVVRASRARFRIADLHHSPYSSGPNSVTSATLKVREVFPPLFAQTGIDLVLAGHDHLYERTRPIEGVTYVTTGAGGDTLYPRVAANSYTEVFYGSEGRHGYTRIEAVGTNLSLRHIDVSDCVVDRAGFYKPIAEGDTWRIFPGTTEPPSGWTEPRFDDRPWSPASLPIGYGGPDIATPIAGMAEPHLTLYARTSFALAPGRVDRILLRLRYDDGFVAYLNGVEVARGNVPKRQTAATPATTEHSGEWFESFEIPVSLLRVGTNVLAIEGHNRRLDDASFLLGPELTLLASEPGHCR